MKKICNFKNLSLLLSLSFFSMPVFAANAATAAEMRQLFADINSLVFYVAIFLGFVMFISGLMGIYNNTKDPQRNPLNNAFIKILIGTILMIPGFFYNVSVNSLFGESWDTVEYQNALDITKLYEIEEEQSSEDSIVKRFQGTKAGAFIYSFIYLIGVYSFLKSLYLCKNLGLINQGPDADSLKGKILTHYFGGIFLMNIMFFTCKFANFFGFGFACEG